MPRCLKAVSAILNAGFYAPIAQALCAAVKRHRTGVQRSHKAIQPSVTPEASALFASPIVLDAGCGEGYYTRALCDAIPNATVIGVDLSRDAIIAAARQAPEKSLACSRFDPAYRWPMGASMP